MTRPLPPHPDRRVRDALRKGSASWFHLGAPRAEVVGEQPADGAPETRSAADVYVYERIGGWFGMTADDFVRDVAGLDVDHINLHLNSPGGDATEGVAMANVLRQHKATVTVWVDGLAASAASVVAMAGDEIVMSLGSQLMIHDAWSATVGDADEMRKAAQMLDSTSNSLASTYAAKAGGTPAEWRAVMVSEAWYSAEEAVAAGLADRVATDEDKGSSSGEQIVPGQSGSYLWDLWDSYGAAERHADTVAALFQHAGRADAPPPPMPGHAPDVPQTPAATAGGSTPTQEGSSAVAFSDEQLTTMRQELGLKADADKATIVAALSEALTEQAQPTVTPPAAASPGTVTVDATQLAALQADAAAGRAARDQQETDRRSSLVAAAVRDGRIARSSTEGWATALARDPHAEANLAALTPGLIPLADIGHADDASSAVSVSDSELDDFAVQLGLPKGALRG